MGKAFFWLVQNIAEYRSSLVSISLPVKLTTFVSFLFSMNKKEWYVLISGTRDAAQIYYGYKVWAVFTETHG